MFILDTAGDTIQAEASAASSLTVSCYGVETASGVETFKKLGQTQLTGSGTQDTIYTVPASTITICSVIVIANTSGSERTIELWHVPNGGSPGDNNALLGEATIAANSSIMWNRGNIQVIPPIAGGAGADVKVAIDAVAAADYIGAASGDGVLRTGTSLSYADGGDFVTLNAIQGIRTIDSPQFANLSIVLGELTCGSINRASGMLTLEIGGVAKLSISATAVTVEGTLFLKEHAAAIADVASYGQIWVKDATPCELWFTDDTGTDVQLGVGGVFPSRVFVGLSSAQSINTGTATKLELDAEDYDINSEFDPVTNHRWTCKVDGYYSINCSAYFIGLDDTKDFYISCRLNNTANICQNILTMGKTYDGTASVSLDYYLEVGDFLEVFVYHNHGSARDVYGSGTNRSTFFSIHRFA